MKNDIKLLNIEQIKVINTNKGSYPIFLVDDGESKYTFFITHEGEVMADYGDCPLEFVADTLEVLKDFIIDVYKDMLDGKYK